MQGSSQETVWDRFAAVTSGSFPLVSAPIESGGKKESVSRHFTRLGKICHDTRFIDFIVQ